MLPTLQIAQPGTLVSVGTERAFMAAANSPSIDSLIIIDRSEAIVTYDRINVLLLKMAKSREHYLRLRLHPEESEWSAMAQEAGLSSGDKELLSTYIDQWKTYVTSGRLFTKFHRPPTSETSAFAGVNYLFDDKSFARIQNLARANRIQIHHFDLEDSEKVNAVVSELKQSGRTVSILDISNAYYSQYMSKEAITKLLTSFDEVASDQTFLVTTEQPLIGSFHYSVYDFEHLRKYRGMENFVRELRRSNFLPRSSATRINPVGVFEACQKWLRGTSDVHQ
jgi:hypothetical protein